MTDQKWRVTEVHLENKYCELPSFDVNILVFLLQYKVLQFRSKYYSFSSTGMGWYVCQHTWMYVYRR